MEDVLIDILEFLELVLALLGHDWQSHRVQHDKDKPCILDILMQLIGDVVCTRHFSRSSCQHQGGS